MVYNIKGRKVPWKKYMKISFYIHTNIHSEIPLLQKSVFRHK